MKLQRGDKLVCIGDSITDCDRARPAGEGLFGAIGRGYVSLVDGLLGATYPERNIRVVNMGSSGNTVLDLKARWETDVFAQKPDWLSVMIGTNDVWRQFDLPRQSEIHVNLDEYQCTYAELLELTRPRLKGLVLMTPFYIEPNRSDLMRARMDEYGAVVKSLAETYDAIFVDTQAAFDALSPNVYAAALAWDRVHPNHVGHMVLARALLQGLEYEW